MSDDLLTAEELAYMRETQAEARPTPATLERRVTVRTPTGGQSDTWTAGEAVTVRLDGSPDSIPAAVAARYDVATLTKVVMDLAPDVRSGDRLTVTPTEVYQFVTDGEPDRWATAQVCYANRQTYPTREA